MSGKAGGRTLRVPGKGTRPTSDRVREALFSRLDHLDVLRDARVLDLFAGSGALGLEAASRGARDVVLVEAAREAADVCRYNVATLGLPGVRVAAERVMSFLERPVGSQADLVLVDPPYELTEHELAEVLRALVKHLDDQAVVVVERSTRSPEPTWPSPRPGRAESRRLARTDERRYGETVLWFAEPTPPAEPATPAPTEPAAAEAAPTVAP